MEEATASVTAAFAKEDELKKASLANAVAQLQGKAAGADPVQQKMMQYMPIIFGFLFYSMPSGLTVYFLVSTVLGLMQQYFVQKAT